MRIRPCYERRADINLGLLGLGTDGEQGHVVAAAVVGEALDGLAHGRHEPRGAGAGRGGGRLEQPVLVEVARISLICCPSSVTLLRSSCQSGDRSSRPRREFAA